MCARERKHTSHTPKNRKEPAASFVLCEMDYHQQQHLNLHNNNILFVLLFFNNRSQTIKNQIPPTSLFQQNSVSLSRSIEMF